MLPEPRILVVSGKSDEPQSIARILADQYQVIEGENAADALSQLSNGVDAVIIDLESPDSDGFNLLRRWEVRQAATPLLAITHSGDVNAAVEAMKLGAADCLTKPLDPNELRSVVSQLIQSRPRNGQGRSQAENETDTRSIEIPPGTSLEDLERAAVEQALAQHQGNRTHAAKTLGISVRTLQRKLKAWGIPVVGLSNASSNKEYRMPTHGGNPSYSAPAH